jgi:hypothetical protein
MSRPASTCRQREPTRGRTSEAGRASGPTPTDQRRKRRDPTRAPWPRLGRVDADFTQSATEPPGIAPRSDGRGRARIAAGFNHSATEATGSNPSTVAEARPRRCGLHPVSDRAAGNRPEVRRPRPGPYRGRLQPLSDGAAGDDPGLCRRCRPVVGAGRAVDRPGLTPPLIEGRALAAHTAVGPNPQARFRDRAGNARAPQVRLTQPMVERRHVLPPPSSASLRSCVWRLTREALPLPGLTRTSPGTLPPVPALADTGPPCLLFGHPTCIPGLPASARAHSRPCRAIAQPEALAF